MTQKDLKTFLQNILRVFENDDDLVISNLRNSAGSNVGDGFMSEVTAAEVLGKRGSGMSYYNNVIIKRAPQNKVRRELFRVVFSFRNENIAYSELLTFAPSFKVHTPLYYYGDDNTIVLENLRVLGYKMFDLSKGMDIAHSELVIKAIAKFHASFYCMRLLDKDNFLQIMSKTHNLSEMNLAMNQTYESSMIGAINNINLLGDKDTADAVRKLESIKGKIIDIIQGFQKSEFIVLGHGDLSVRNMMFRYENEVVRNVKIIDYQGISATSPAFDLWMFLYTCLMPETLNAHCDSLISSYCSFFQETLKEVNIPLMDIPSTEIITKEITSRELYGFLIAVVYLPVHYINFSSINLDEVLSKTDFSNDQKNFVDIDFGKRVAALLKRCQMKCLL